MPATQTSTSHDLYHDLSGLLFHAQFLLDSKQPEQLLKVYKKGYIGNDDEERRKLIEFGFLLVPGYLTTDHHGFVKASIILECMRKNYLALQAWDNEFNAELSRFFLIGAKMYALFQHPVTSITSLLLSIKLAISHWIDVPRDDNVLAVSIQAKVSEEAEFTEENFNLLSLLSELANSQLIQDLFEGCGFILKTLVPNGNWKSDKSTGLVIAAIFRVAELCFEQIRSKTDNTYMTFATILELKYAVKESQKAPMQDLYVLKKTILSQWLAIGKLIDSEKYGIATLCWDLTKFLDNRSFPMDHSEKDKIIREHLLSGIKIMLSITAMSYHSFAQVKAFHAQMAQTYAQNSFEYHFYDQCGLLFDGILVVDLLKYFNHLCEYLIDDKNEHRALVTHLQQLLKFFILLINSSNYVDSNVEALAKSWNPIQQLTSILAKLDLILVGEKKQVAYQKTLLSAISVSPNLPYAVMLTIADQQQTISDQNETITLLKTQVERTSALLQKLENKVAELESHKRKRKDSLSDCDSEIAISSAPSSPPGGVEMPPISAPGHPSLQLKN